MIQKRKLFYNKLTTFLGLKASADKNNTTYRTGSLSSDVLTGEPDIMYQSIVFIKDVGMIWTHGGAFSYNLTDEQIDAISVLFAEGTTGATLENLITRVTDLENKTNAPYKLYEETEYEALTADDMEQGYLYCEMEPAEGGTVSVDGNTVTVSEGVTLTGNVVTVMGATFNNNTITI